MTFFRHSVLLLLPTYYYYCYYHHHHHYFHLMAILLGEPGSAGSISGPPPSVLGENLWRLVEQVLWARCPSCHQNISVKALYGIESTHP